MKIIERRHLFQKPLMIVPIVYFAIFLKFMMFDFIKSRTTFGCDLSRGLASTVEVRAVDYNPLANIPPPPSPLIVTAVPFLRHIPAFYSIWLHFFDENLILAYLYDAKGSNNFDI